MPGYEAVAWHGMLAPRVTPLAVMATINRLMSEVVLDSETNKKIRPQGVNGAGGTPDQFRAPLKAKIDGYAMVIRDANIKAGEQASPRAEGPQMSEAVPGPGRAVLRFIDVCAGTPGLWAFCRALRLC